MSQGVCLSLAKFPNAKGEFLCSWSKKQETISCSWLATKNPTAVVDTICSKAGLPAEQLEVSVDTPAGEMCFPLVDYVQAIVSGQGSGIWQVVVKATLVKAKALRTASKAADPADNRAKAYLRSLAPKYCQLHYEGYYLPVTAVDCWFWGIILAAVIGVKDNTDCAAKGWQWCKNFLVGYVSYNAYEFRQAQRAKENPEAAQPTDAQAAAPNDAPASKKKRERTVSTETINTRKIWMAEQEKAWGKYWISGEMPPQLEGHPDLEAFKQSYAHQQTSNRGKLVDHHWREGLTTVQPTSTEEAEEADNPAAEGSLNDLEDWPDNEGDTPAKGALEDDKAAPPAVTVTKELQFTTSWASKPKPKAVARVAVPAFMAGQAAVVVPGAVKPPEGKKKAGAAVQSGRSKKAKQEQQQQQPEETDKKGKENAASTAVNKGRKKAAAAGKVNNKQ
ncbi:hypothetical protein N2152v2_008091 [Parachlorella kessleri]